MFNTSSSYEDPSVFQGQSQLTVQCICTVVTMSPNILTKIILAIIFSTSNWRVQNDPWGISHG